MSRPSSITLEDCQSLFYLPVAQAAAVLGVSRPTISKVLRANGIKRWPYRKLRAEGKISVLRQRREHPLPDVLPVLPPPPPPLPLPSFVLNFDNHQQLQTNLQDDQSVNTQPLLEQPLPSTPDDETCILNLFEQPLSQRHIEDHTHPYLTLQQLPEWTCNEQLSEQNPDPEHHTQPSDTPPSPVPQLIQHQEETQHFHPDARSHTTSTVCNAARAVVGATDWSRGVFRHDGDRTTFTFLPPVPFGSSLSDEDPLNVNIASQL